MQFVESKYLEFVLVTTNVASQDAIDSKLSLVYVIDKRQTGEKAQPTLLVKQVYDDIYGVTRTLTMFKEHKWVCYTFHVTTNRWISFMSITRHRTRNIHLEQFWDGFLHTSLFRIYVFEIIYENQMYHISRFYNVSQIHCLNLNLCEISCANCSTLNNIILGETADPINKTSGEISSHNLLRIR